MRDVRGFAVKFYTDEGNFDLVGNNMPVFFIQDGIKFPDIIHAAKPHPDREIPQAQTAHDTFWDFVSLHTEATHHVLWAMSDRGIPRSYRTMEGFGVHTFRLVNAPAASRAWSSSTGSQWPASTRWSGRRRRSPPAWTPTSTAATWPTGSMPERSSSTNWACRSCPTTGRTRSRASTCSTRPSWCPKSWRRCSSIGKLTLNRNPTNYFAETEQVAFHTGNLVPGIEVTNDPLMQARLFSYLDTQLTRLGGPNFTQLPINAPRTAR